MMARCVYADGRTFASIANLKIAIQEAWYDISIVYSNSLLNSIPNRLFEVIGSHGDHTHH
jgi:hypothetical protein